MVARKLRHRPAGADRNVANEQKYPANSRQWARRSAWAKDGITRMWAIKSPGFMGVPARFVRPAL
jgi:hypothetical protein